MVPFRHLLGSFVETNKTATRGILPDASPRLTTELLSITERTADLEPSNVRNRDQCRRSNSRQRRAFSQNAAQGLEQLSDRTLCTMVVSCCEESFKPPAAQTMDWELWLCLFI